MRLQGCKLCREATEIMYVGGGQVVNILEKKRWVKGPET